MTGQAMVASGHGETTAAAVAVLEAGGNAFDAIVAAGFASAVAEPALTSLGGGGFCLARPAGGAAILFDFFSDTPGRGGSSENKPHFFPVTVSFSGSDQDFNVGLGSVAVPGNLAGYLHFHRRLGRLPLAEVVAPAARLAREGVVLTEQQAHFLALLEPIMTMTAAGRAIFAPHGSILGPGARLRNLDLAAFLEELPRDQGRSLYHGELGRRVAEEMAGGGGLLTAADLAAYQVVERQPLSGSYRGRTILTNPPPSVGGGLILMGLGLLEAAGGRDWSWLGKRQLHHLAAVSRLVETYWEGGGNDDRDSLRARFCRDTACCSRGTTHVSLVDGEGNVAAMTTSNGEGSGYLVPGTGIMLNNMMGEDDLHPEGFHAAPPGKRVVSMMSPTILLEGDEVRLVLGSGGSKRIRTAITQVISHVVDGGVDTATAVAAPRVHWDLAAWQVEPGFSDQAVSHLAAHGPVNLWPGRDVYFGGVHAVAPGRDCAGDPRRGGATGRLAPRRERQP